MKVLGFYISLTNWKASYCDLYSKLKKAYERDFIDRSIAEAKAAEMADMLTALQDELDETHRSNLDMCQQNDALRATLECVQKENSRLQAIVDAMNEDELAIRCTSLQDENNHLKERIAKYEEAAEKARAANAEKARRYRKAKKRVKENPNIIDLDVLQYEARQLGYDLEMRVTEDGINSFHLIARENGKDVYSASTIQIITHIIEKRRKEIYGED